MSGSQTTNNIGRVERGRRSDRGAGTGTGLLRDLVDAYLRVGLLAIVAFVSVTFVAELARRQSPGLGLSVYPRYSQYPEPPSPHPAGLAAQDVERLLNGQDGEYSRTAAFHGYPAPSTVLGLAEELALSPEQTRQLENLLARTQDAARGIGGEIVHLEAQLGLAFGEGAVSSGYLHKQSERLGWLYGRLRAIHLESYVAAVDILRPDQLEQYRKMPSPEEITTE